MPSLSSRIAAVRAARGVNRLRVVGRDLEREDAGLDRAEMIERLRREQREQLAVDRKRRQL
jgi:hypothetical protein